MLHYTWPFVAWALNRLLWPFGARRLYVMLEPKEPSFIHDYAQDESDESVLQTKAIAHLGALALAGFLVVFSSNAKLPMPPLLHSMAIVYVLLGWSMRWQVEKTNLELVRKALNILPNDTLFRSMWWRAAAWLLATAAFASLSWHIVLYAEYNTGLLSGMLWISMAATICCLAKTTRTAFVYRDPF